MADKFSSFCIGGTSSGDGKTTIAIALLRALRNRGLNVQPFKCGPDYIDPTFHRIASVRSSRNLDGWMMGPDAVRNSFAQGCRNADCAVIEGVMGLFDSSAPGSYEGSTAQIAELTGSQVVLTINARGMANSIAAMVKGYCEFNPALKIAGVIANKVGSENHANILRESLKLAGLPPLLGYLPRNEDWQLPERHLGLVPFLENEKSEDWFNELAEAAEKCFDIDLLLQLTSETRPEAEAASGFDRPKLRLGLALDQAFHFYYRDNLEILEDRGFELVPFSPIKDTALPPGCDALYIGGGFPEEFAAELAANQAMRHAIKVFPGTILAECGGYMYLAKAIDQFPMCGVVPAEAVMNNRLRSLGYRQVELLHDTFLGPVGTGLRGHEFHWSSIAEESFTPLWNSCRAAKNSETVKCGFFNGKIAAGYIHLHFASNPVVVDNWYNHILKTGCNIGHGN